MVLTLKAFFSSPLPKFRATPLLNFAVAMWRMEALRCGATQMRADYVTAPRTNGANPFKIFEALPSLNQDSLAYTLKHLSYPDFLKTAYWFAVSHVAKSRAGMRCQVCNCATGIQVHHRTYDTHGREHANMSDLVVLCEHCHGLFHGHKQVIPKALEAPVQPRDRVRRHKGFVAPHSEADLQMPDGDPIILTRELVSRCRANGSFTNATLRAFGLTKAMLIAGWPSRLVGKAMTREDYRKALEGRFIYNSGPLE